MAPRLRESGPGPRPMYVAGIRELHEAGPGLRGGGTTMSELARDRLVPRAVREAAASIGSPAVRNWATLGGNLAAGAPGCVATALLTLGCWADLMTRHGKPTSAPLAEVIGRERNLIVAVRWDTTRRSRFAKVRAGALGPVLCTAAVSTDQGGADVRIAAGQAGQAPRRLQPAEAGLAAARSPGVPVTARLDGGIRPGRESILLSLIEQLAVRVAGEE